MTPPRGLDQGILKKVNGVWIFTYTAIDKAGKRSRGSHTLGPSKRIAEAEARKLIDKRNERLYGVGPDERPNEPWRPWLERWRTSYAKERGDLNARRSAARLERVLDGVDAVSFGDITIGAVTLYLDELSDRFSASTVNDYIASLRVFLSWCVQREVIPEENAIRPKYLSVSGALERPEFTEEQVAAIFAAGRARDAAARRNWGAFGSGSHGRLKYAQPFPRMHTIEFLTLTISRPGAARQVRNCDVYREPEKRFVHFRAATMKAKNDVYVPIEGALEELIDRIDATHLEITGRVGRPEETLLRSPAGLPWTKNSHPLVKWFQSAMKDAGIEKEVPGFKDRDVYCLRGFGVTRMLRATRDPVLVAKIGGWTDPKVMLRHYEKLNLGDTREAIGAMQLPTGITEQIAGEAPDAGSGGARAPPKFCRRLGLRRRLHSRRSMTSAERISPSPPH